MPSTSDHERGAYQSLLGEIREVLEALDRCASRIRWTARRATSTIPNIGLDFDVIYPLFDISIPDLESTEHLSRRLYRDTLSRAAVGRFIEDPTAQNIFLPRGAATEMMAFLRQYAAARSLESPLLSALQHDRGPRNRSLLPTGSTFAGASVNLGLIAGELSEYANAQPIATILTNLQKKIGAAAHTASEFEVRSATFHFALEQMRLLRPNRHIGNFTDAANLDETAALLSRVGSSSIASGPPVLVSTSRALQVVGGRLGEFLRQDLDGYPLVGSPVDLILTHTIVQRKSQDDALSTLTELRESLLPTVAALSELMEARQNDDETTSHLRRFEGVALGESLERFRSIWRSINSKTLLDSAGMELAFSAQLVELGTPTTEGRLVVAVSIVWDEILCELERNPRILFEFARAPEKFEELVAGAYKKHGWDHVELTPRSGDRGRDVIASKTGFGAVRFLDQVKAYSPGHLVTHEEVRAMIGVLALDQNASKALVTTTSDFAPGVLISGEFRGLMPNRLELKNGQQLHRWLLDAHLGKKF